MLDENDILLIVLSHIIRPHGHILFEYLSVLPGLHPVAIMHIHRCNPNARKLGPPCCADFVVVEL